MLRNDESTDETRVDDLDGGLVEWPQERRPCDENLDCVVPDNFRNPDIYILNALGRSVLFKFYFVPFKQ